jgi:hypothetical protein
MTHNKTVLPDTGRHKEGKNKLAKLKRESYEKEEETGDFPSINLYNMEVLVQKGEEEYIRKKCIRTPFPMTLYN